jgi:hypothetical protein
MNLRHFISTVLLFCLLTGTVFAEEAADRFHVVVDRMVDAINKLDYPGIQKDFDRIMLEEFPLEESKPFFRKMLNRSGKIKYLDAPLLVPPNKAIFPAHFEREFIDITIVLNEQNKISGLWFLAHTASIPVPEKHSSLLELPFQGQWMTFWGGDTKKQNIHHDVFNQKYAFDFVKIDKNGKTHKNKGEENEDYLAFAQNVLAPGDGIVTDVINGVRDNTPGSLNPYSALGNAVIIKHRELEISVLAHFKQNSIRVKVGDRVRQGQILGLCGNSGNSSEPHIHYHLQNTPIIQEGSGIKCSFENIALTKNGKEESKARYSPVKGEVVWKDTE